LAGAVFDIFEEGLVVNYNKQAVQVLAVQVLKV
jgi:hypothetical protein